MEEVVYGICNQVLSEATVPVDRLSQDEKIAIVEKLDGKGVFLFKGAVALVAGRLQTSEATIYRYLSKINRARIFTKAESRGVYDTRIQQHGQQYYYVAGLCTGSIDRVVPGISLLPAQ